MNVKRGEEGMNSKKNSISCHLPLFPGEVPGLERVLRGAHVDALVVVYQRLLKPAKKTPLDDKTRKKR